MIPQFKQNKIEGMSIAWARGKWAEIDPGVWGYIFPEDDAFAIRKNPQELEDWGISHDDLYDCIALIEEMFGAPKDHRLSFGLLPNQGYSNIGTTVTSRTNPSITCTFTPTSLEDNSYDGYFNWYYHENGGIQGIKSFMTRFDMATKTQTTNILASPTMPTYGEACERTEGILDEAERERFVTQVWNYHKTAPRGYKLRIEAEILPLWKKVLEANIATPMAHVKHPFKSYNGVEWSRDQVKSYNRQVDKVNKYIEAGKIVPDNVLNGMNNLFKSFSMKGDKLRIEAEILPIWTQILEGKKKVPWLKQDKFGREELDAKVLKKYINSEYGFIVPKEFSDAGNVRVSFHNSLDMALDGGGQRGKVVDFYKTGMAIKFNAAFVNNKGSRLLDSLAFVTLPKNKKVKGAIRMWAVAIDPKVNSGTIYFAAANSKIMGGDE